VKRGLAIPGSEQQTIYQYRGDRGITESRQIAGLVDESQHFYGRTKAVAQSQAAKYLQCQRTDNRLFCNKSGQVCIENAQK